MCLLKGFDGRTFRNGLCLVEVIEEISRLKLSRESNAHPSFKPTAVFVYLFVCFFTGPCEVYDVAPWTNAHLQMRKFSDRLKDLEELVYLYPHIEKNDAFGQYYTNDGNDPAYSAHDPII